MLLGLVHCCLAFIGKCSVTNSNAQDRRDKRGLLLHGMSLLLVSEWDGGHHRNSSLELRWEAVSAGNVAMFPLALPSSF